MEQISIVVWLFTIIDTLSHFIPAVSPVQDYIIIISGYGVVSAYFVSMIFLTLDRLLDILLSIKYPIYCTTQRAKYLVAAIWISCLSVGEFFFFLFVVFRLIGFAFYNKLYDIFTHIVIFIADGAIVFWPPADQRFF